MPDANSLDLTTGMTLAAWIRPGVTVNTTQDVIKKATNGGINGYELSLSSAGKVFVRLNQVASGDTYRINSTTDYPLNNTAWMHVAATYDGTTIRLYINGVQEGGDLAGPAAITTNSLAVGLGAQSDNTRRFTGLLDDARIYGSALSASQIAALAGIPNAPTLNSPADGATGVGTSPTLSVGVSDPDANPLTVTFFGRPFASGNFAQIGQNTGVASGTNTTTSWANIGAGQKFEWYVTVSDGTATTTGPTWTFNTAAGADPMFVGTGDIASCDVTTDTDTGLIIEGIQGAIWTTGDNVYDFGTPEEWTNCYAPTPWGSSSVKSRTRPVPGNHDWGTGGPREDLVPYFAYFGANATDGGGKSYYSYDIAGSNWHVVNLDSECQLVPGGCAAGSPQDLWLEADLAANSTENVIAIWHKPRYSSGATNYQAMQALWDDLYAAGVDILLDGHDHIYERTVPMKSGATLAIRPSPIPPMASGSSPSGPAVRRITGSPRRFRRASSAMMRPSGSSSSRFMPQRTTGCSCRSPAVRSPTLAQARYTVPRRRSPPAAGGRWTATPTTARVWPTMPASSAARPSWPARSVRRCRSTARARTRACPTPTAST